MMVSLLGHEGGMINDDHDVDADLLCIFQQCDNTVETISRALPECAAIFYATRTHIATKPMPK